MNTNEYLSKPYAKSKSTIIHYAPECIGVGFLLAVVLSEYVCILMLNGGKLVYTLDDPYIHLALAENIWNGHFGINTNEFSSPSSSILWPFILAPMVSWTYSPFILNLICAIATIQVYIKMLRVAFNFLTSAQQAIIISVTAIALTLATNLVGLIFIGMEHTLQVLLVALTAYGLIQIANRPSVPTWLLISIALAPLVRYENLSVSMVALIYLMTRGYSKQAAITAVIMIILIGSYSLFLSSLELGLLPSSIEAKSSILNGRSGLDALTFKLNNILMHPINTQSRLIFTAMFILFTYALYANESHRSQLAYMTAASIAMHLAFGQFGWYNRYEIYTLTFSLLMIIYLFAPISKTHLSTGMKPLLKFSTLVLLLGIYIGLPYIKSMFSLPIASNNIYQQQYQMHRFATDFHQGPVAVNDIGYVSYDNDHYVLDLWGLASIRTLKLRMEGKNPDWLGAAVAERHIGLVMIYDHWFAHIPEEWTKLGELHLGRRKITPESSLVKFYSTYGPHTPSHQQLLNKLNTFVETLPSGTTFMFE